MLIIRIMSVIATLIFLWGAIAEYKNTENFYKLICGFIISVFVVVVTYIFR